MSKDYPKADTSTRRLEEIKAYWREAHEELNRVKGPLASESRNHSHRLVYDLLGMIEENIDYKKEYTKCVEAASVFQYRALAYLMKLGQSTTLDGPKAAAKEIARLKRLLGESSP